MKRTNSKKIASLILSIVLIAAMALFAAGCADSAAQGDTIVVADGDTLGSGAVSFPLTITDQDGKEVNVTINTDKKTVGEALVDVKLLAGEDGEFGMYIKTVNGITADYDVNGTYWAFYIDGEYAMAGVDMTDITPGSSYALKVEK